MGVQFSCLFACTTTFRAFCGGFVSLVNQTSEKSRTKFPQCGLMRPDEKASTSHPHQQRRKPKPFLTQFPVHKQFGDGKVYSSLDQLHQRNPNFKKAPKKNQASIQKLRIKNSAPFFWQHILTPPKKETVKTHCRHFLLPPIGECGDCCVQASF